MIWWAIAAGALIGWFSAGLEPYGLVLGALFGAPMGLWLRSAIRSELRQAAASYEAAPSPGEDQPAPRPAPAPARAKEDVVPPFTVSRPTPAPVRTPPPAAQPIVPSMAEQLVQKAMGWLLGGNTILRAGLVILFIGLVFLARLAASAGLFPIEARLATIGAAGAALLAIGFWKRTARPDFALHLQGAGIAVLYLTVFAAARFYDVMPPGAAFAFMVLFAALGAALAVLQNSQVMALASFLGGYAVPVMLGGEAETPLGLFGYITVLNAAILGIAWKRSWRALNLLGFFATFALAGIWGLDAYSARHFWLCEIFLAINVAIYLLTALLYAHNTPGRLGNFADSTLLFGTAIAGFGLQAALVHDQPYASAWSALAFGAVYLGVASWAFRRRDTGMGLLSESLLAIGVGFVTLAIPLALELKWVGVAWALEGAGALWVGMRQARWMPRLFGLAMQALGAIVALQNMPFNASDLPLLNPRFLEPLLIAAALLFAAWLLREPLAHSGSDWAKRWHPIERGLAKPWFLGGFAMACFAMKQELERQVIGIKPESSGEFAYGPEVQIFGFLLSVLALMALADWFGRKRQWHVASWPARLSLPLIGAVFLLSLIIPRFVIQLPDLLVWTIAFALHFWMLHRADRDPETAAPRWNGFIHAMGALGLSAMLADALFYLIDQADLWDSSWAGVVLLVAGAAVLGAIVRWFGPATKAERALQMGWPYNVHSRAYWWRAAMVIAGVLWLGATAGTLISQGRTDPLPYIPLLNPVDLSIALVLAALALWRQMLKGADPMPRGTGLVTGRFGLALGGVLGFAWINTIWTRTAAHYLGAEWDPIGGGTSQVVLTGFSILWTLAAMGLMLLGQRRADRLPWLAGAALLALVVLKLIFVDSSAIDGAAQIVAFIGTGVLMLLIGYFVPLPPRKKEEPA